MYLTNEYTIVYTWEERHTLLEYTGILICMLVNTLSVLSQEFLASAQHFYSQKLFFE